MNTQNNHEPEDRPEAVQQADVGARAWRAVVHAQSTKRSGQARTGRE